MTPALDLDSVVVTAGHARLLDDVSLKVEPGRIVAVVGANGAGKTTLLDTICGLHRCAEGHVGVDGHHDVGRVGPRHGVARAFQGSPLPDTLTVAEVASLVTADRTSASALLERFGLTPHASSFVAELSTGMRRILDLAVTTAHEPAVLLLDEPSSGLAPSEVEHLGDLILRWRDETNAAILVVEHDQALVRRIADEIVALDGGRITGRGTPEELLDGHVHTSGRARLRAPTDAAFLDSLARVAEEAVPAVPPQRRMVSTWTLLRLGLREFAGGLASVLILGVLNRVMKVELGISLAAIAAVLATYNLAAPFAIMIGHRSDTHPIRGRHRAPYILAGTAVTGIALALVPHVAGRLTSGITAASLGLAIGLFLLMGLGTYGSGVTYLALLHDVVPEEQRGHAISVVYLELVLGIVAGVALSASILDEQANGLPTLFAIAGILVFVLTLAGVWGMEERARARLGDVRSAAPEVKFVPALRAVVSLPQSRAFFTFMTLATMFLFLQQAVLEPFGGDVLGLDVRATSAFNVVQTVGILVAIVFAGRGMADRIGLEKVAGVGLVVSSLAFGGLALSALTSSVPGAWFAILAVGLAMGLFSVATLALMVSLADPRRAALFMGFWTLARAIADGVSTAGGGTIFEVARSFAGSDAGAYATVFGVEAVGLLLCLPLLRRVDRQRFHAQAEGDDGSPDDGGALLPDTAFN